MQTFLQLVARKMRQSAPIHLSIGDIDTPPHTGCDGLDRFDHAVTSDDQ